MKKQMSLFILSALVLFFSSVELVSAGIFNLPKTGQTKCYKSGTETSCAGTGQDGEKRAGIAWPNPRFTDNSNGTITDNLTGLIWTKDGGTPGPAACSPGVGKLWREASDYINCLNTNNYLEYNDWRLPNINEIESLINAEVPDNSAWLSTQGFTNNLYRVYCSSTTFTSWDGKKNESFAVNMQNSQIYGYLKTWLCDLWPIRTGPHGIASIQKTGQSKCYDTTGSEIVCLGTGQDGEKRSGVEWPSPRFTDNGSGAVTDNLTGLMWTQDNNSPGPSTCNMDIYGTNDRATTWQNALEFIKCINKNNYLGHNDWRLPNKKELFSLLDFSNYNPPLQSGHPFTNSGSQSVMFRSSTTSTNSYSPGQWVLDFNFFYPGSLFNAYPSDTYSLWPVRTEKAGTYGNNCVASVSSSLVVHVPIVNYSGYNFWVDLQYASSDSTLTFTNCGLINDMTSYSNCTASTLSSDLKLHIPALLLGSSSYWLDLQYGSSGFVITGVGVN